MLWWVSLPRHETLHKDIKLKKVRGWSEMENRLTGAKIIFHYTLKPHTVPMGFFLVFLSRAFGCPLAAVHSGFILLSVLPPVPGVASVKCQFKFSCVSLLLLSTCIHTV